MSVSKKILFAAALAATGTSATQWRITETYDTSNFFDKFDFFTGADPTFGHVNYRNRKDATDLGLIGVDGKDVFIKPDTKKTVGSEGRSSVRIESKTEYTQGLFIARFSKVPTPTCGAWPAFWTYGDPWVEVGEIDLIEQWNDRTWNQPAIHTGPSSKYGQCKLSQADGRATVLTDNCDNTFSSQATGQSEYQGCTVNDNAGPWGSKSEAGVYAMEWTSNFLKLYSFTGSNVPTNIDSDYPDTASWGQPMMQLKDSSCDIDKHFANQKLVFNIDFCGNPAGIDYFWNEESKCAKKTGYATCVEYVSKKPGDFVDAFFKIRDVRIFEEGAKPEPTTSSVPEPEPTSTEAATTEEPTSTEDATTEEPTETASATEEPTESASATEEPTETASATEEPSGTEPATETPSATETEGPEPTETDDCEDDDEETATESSGPEPTETEPCDDETTTESSSPEPTETEPCDDETATESSSPEPTETEEPCDDETATESSGPEPTGSYPEEPTSESSSPEPTGEYPEGPEESSSPVPTGEYPEGPEESSSPVPTGEYPEGPEESASPVPTDDCEPQPPAAPEPCYGYHCPTGSEEASPVPTGAYPEGEEEESPVPEGEFPEGEEEASPVPEEEYPEGEEEASPVPEEEYPEEYTPGNGTITDVGGPLPTEPVIAAGIKGGVSLGLVALVAFFAL